MHKQPRQILDLLQPVITTLNLNAKRETGVCDGYFIFLNQLTLIFNLWRYVMLTRKLKQFLQGTMMITGKEFRILSLECAFMIIAALIAAFTTSFGSIYRDIPAQSEGSLKQFVVTLINAVDNHDNIMVGLIAALISLAVILVIYYFFVKINNVFVKASEKTITTPQTPWFLFSSLLMAIVYAYFFFFYRNVFVDHIFTGAIFYPVARGASAWLMFFSSVLFIYTTGKLTYQSIKDYGTKTGVMRAVIFSIVTFIVAIAEMIFIVALLWLIVGIVVLYFMIGLMMGGISETLNTSNTGSTGQSSCPVCGQIGGHGIGCGNGGAFNQKNGQTARNSTEYQALNH
jgi:Flp pilus assembly pilin Flp